MAARLYVPSLVTWWRLRSLVLLSALSVSSFSPLSLLLSSPNPISYSTIAGLSRECSLPCFRTPFSSIIPSPLPLLSLLLLCKEQRDTQKTSTRSEPTLLLDFHSVDHSFAHNGYRVTRSWRSPCSPSFFLFTKPALFLLVSSRRPTRRALLCPFSLSVSLSSSSVINSVNDQIYGGGSGTKTGDLTAVRFSAWCGMHAQWMIYRLTLLHLLSRKLVVAVSWHYVRSGIAFTIVFLPKSASNQIDD